VTLRGAPAALRSAPARRRPPFAGSATATPAVAGFRYGCDFVVCASLRHAAVASVSGLGACGASLPDKENRRIWARFLLLLYKVRIWRFLARIHSEGNVA